MTVDDALRALRRDIAELCPNGSADGGVVPWTDLVASKGLRCADEVTDAPGAAGRGSLILPSL